MAMTTVLPDYDQRPKTTYTAIIIVDVQVTELVQNQQDHHVTYNMHAMSWYSGQNRAS